MGIVVSLAVAGAIFQNRAVTNVLRILPGVDITIIRGAITGTNSAYFSGLAPADGIRVIEGIVRALSDVYVVVIFAGTSVIILAIFLPVSDRNMSMERSIANSRKKNKLFVGEKPERREDLAL